MALAEAVGVPQGALRDKLALTGREARRSGGQAGGGGGLSVSDGACMGVHLVGWFRHGGQQRHGRHAAGQVRHQAAPGERPPPLLLPSYVPLGGG